MNRKNMRRLSLCSALLVLAMCSSHSAQAIEREPECAKRGPQLKGFFFIPEGR